MGFIGEEETQREIELEPFPEKAPAQEPAAPPTPAPAEPDRVPA